jgi:hypothetical protein
MRAGKKLEKKVTKENGRYYLWFSIFWESEYIPCTQSVVSELEIISDWFECYILFDFPHHGVYRGAKNNHILFFKFDESLCLFLITYFLDEHG